MKDILLTVALGATALVMCGLLAVEIKVWLDCRSDPERAKGAVRRLARRGTGAILLLLVLLLLKWPSADSLTVVQRFYKILGCLTLSVVVFAIAIWDFRIMRGEVKMELQGFVNQSAEAIRNQLADIAAKDPEFKKKLAEMAARNKKASKNE